MSKPLWQMTGEEFLILANSASPTTGGSKKSETEEKASARKYVYGLTGIAQLFGCSKPTASRIKQSGKIDRAIKQIGRKIIVDADLALELAGRKSGGRK